MSHLPPPDPYELHREDPPGLELGAPAVVYLAGEPSPEAARLSSAILDARPGALIVVAAD